MFKLFLIVLVILNCCKIKKDCVYEVLCYVYNNKKLSKNVFIDYDDSKNLIHIFSDNNSNLVFTAEIIFKAFKYYFSRIYKPDKNDDKSLLFNDKSTINGMFPLFKNGQNNFSVCYYNKSKIYY